MRSSPVFLAAVLLKGFNAVWETISGALVLALGSRWLASAYLASVQGELLEDPHDRVVNFAGKVLHHASAGSVQFAALYILFHGVLNAFLCIQLLRRQLWAYPAVIALHLAAMAYQVHRISVHHSLLLTMFTAYDCLFVILALREYRLQRQALHPAS
jgi:uncharacterized membrane protein